MAKSPLKVELTQAEQRKFNNLIREMQKTTGAEMAKVVRNASRDVAKAAQKFTPIAGRKSNRWFKVPTSYRTKADGSPIYVFRGRGIKFRGMAKGAWSGVLNRLGLKRRSRRGSGPTTAEREFSEARKTTGKGKVAFIFANTVPFIQRLDSGNFPGSKGPLHIQARSIKKVSNDTEKRLNRMAKRVIKKTVGI